MTILVTGGTGFIGSALCLNLVKNTSCDVVNIDALTYAAQPASLSSINDEDNYTFVQADITDKSAIDQVFKKHKPKAVFHLAAESHVDRSIIGARAFIDTNVTGTLNLLEASRTHWESLSAKQAEDFRFIHVSTDEVYGSLGQTGLFSEQTIYDPSSPYSASKAASDHLAMAWHRTYGLPVIISNCSNNYGPRQFPEKLIPLMIISALYSRPLPIYGDGSNIRDWLYVEDHINALLLILEKGIPGEKYNVGGRNEYSNLEVVSIICKELDKMRPSDKSYIDFMEFVLDRPGHDQRYAIDASKLENTLGWQSSVSFEVGISKTIDWYLSNESWWKTIVANENFAVRLGITELGESK